MAASLKWETNKRQKCSKVLAFLAQVLQVVFEARRQIKGKKCPSAPPESGALGRVQVTQVLRPSGHGSLLIRSCTCLTSLTPPTPHSRSHTDPAPSLGPYKAQQLGCHDDILDRVDQLPLALFQLESGVGPVHPALDPYGLAHRLVHDGGLMAGAGLRFRSRPSSWWSPLRSM